MKQDKLKEYVEKIKKENIVVNNSDKKVPTSVYLFLTKGLGFVPTRKVDLQDLKYDTSDFIRKLEWKAFLPSESKNSQYLEYH